MIIAEVICLPANTRHTTIPHPIQDQLKRCVVLFYVRPLFVKHYADACFLLVYSEPSFSLKFHTLLFVCRVSGLQCQLCHKGIFGLGLGRKLRASVEVWRGAVGCGNLPFSRKLRYVRSAVDGLAAPRKLFSIDLAAWEHWAGGGGRGGGKGVPLLTAMLWALGLSVHENDPVTQILGQIQKSYVTWRGDDARSGEREKMKKFGSTSLRIYVYVELVFIWN